MQKGCTRAFAWTAAGIVSLAPVSARADEVYLRGGGHVSGIILERTPETVRLETAPGTVAIPMSRVERIEESRSFLGEWRERMSSLSPRDADGWTALARWAQDRDLVTQARTAWEHVLALDPSHPEANAALGNVKVGDRWMSSEEGNRARGLVPYDGRWVSEPELRALVQERAADEAAARERREADLRVREAEARAREAEANARAAEASAQETGGGIPIGWPIGFERRHPPRPCCSPHPPEPTPRPRPTPSPRTPTSLGPITSQVTPGRGAVHPRREVGTSSLH
jgi:hypothetical protein